jgi:hypothetical protein
VREIEGIVDAFALFCRLAVRKNSQDCTTRNRSRRARRQTRGHSPIAVFGRVGGSGRQSCRSRADLGTRRWLDTDREQANSGLHRCAQSRTKAVAAGWFRWLAHSSRDGSGVGAPRRHRHLVARATRKGARVSGDGSGRRAGEPHGGRAGSCGGAWRICRANECCANRIGCGAWIGRASASRLVWRNRRTGLSAWYDAIAARPSFQSTVPPSL